MHRLLTDSSLLFLDIISPHAIIIAFSEVIKVAYLTLNLYCIHVMHVKAYSVCTASFSLEDIMNLSREDLIPMRKYVSSIYLVCDFQLLHVYEICRSMKSK